MSSLSAVLDSAMVSLFTIAGTPITLTALAIAAIAGILLNIILPGNDYEFGVNEAGDENRGIHASTGKKNA